MAIIIPSPAKIHSYSSILTSLAHPGIVRTGNAARILISSFPKPPYDINCVNLTGASAVAHVVDPHQFLAQAKNALTVEFLTKLSFIPTGLPESFGFWTMMSNGVNFAGFQFYMQQSDGSVNFRFLDQTSNLRLVSFIPTLNTNTWYHFAATYDGQTEILYFNGAPVSKLLTVGTVQWGSANLNMGAYALGSGTAYQWRSRAYLSELRIWAEARTQEDIYANMFKSISNPSSKSTLVGYWKLDGGLSNSTTVTDSSLSGQNGTLDSGTNTIYLYRPLQRNVQLINRQRPTTVGVLKTPTSNSIHFSVPTPKIIRTQHPASSSIHLSANAIKSLLTQHPAANSIHISAHAPKNVFISRIYPTHATIHLSAQNIKANRTQKPASSSIHISAIAPKAVTIGTIVKPSSATIHLAAKAPKNVQITRIYATPATIHLSAKSPKTVGISRVYATHATIHLLAQAPGKINRVQKPSASSIHMAVSPPTNRLTQHVSRAIIHLSNPPPKIALVSRPSRSVININVPIQHTMFNQVVRPSHATIHLAARNVIANTIVVHYAFTVKIKTNLNFKVILTTK